MTDKSTTKSVGVGGGGLGSVNTDPGLSHNWQLRMQRHPQSLPLEYPSMAVSFKNLTASLFKNVNQNGFLSILYAIGQRPLENFEKQIRQGHIKRVTDTDIRSLAMEVMGSNVQTTFISAPPNPHQVLGVRLPILFLVVKNMKRHFTFEVQILDDSGVRRRFYWSNFQQTTKVGPFYTQIPMRLEEGWNQLQVNLADLTRKVYGTSYLETIRVQVNANCRIRRIYFCDAASAAAGTEEEIPADFKAFVLNAAGGHGSEPKIGGTTTSKMHDKF